MASFTYRTATNTYRTGFMHGVLIAASVFLIGTGLGLALFGPTYGPWRFVPFLLVALPGAVVTRIVWLAHDRT